MEYVKESNIKNIQDLVTICYSECDRSRELYHDYAGFSVKECSANFAEKLNSLNGYDFYLVYDNSELIGYFGTTEIDNLDCLYTFFVRPKFRKSDYLKKYWKLIESKFDGNFFAGVYSSNQPAKSFLTKSGGQLIQKDNISYFIFKRE